MSAGALRVASARGAYDVRIGPGLLSSIGKDLGAEGRRVALVTDRTVGGLYGGVAEAALRAVGAVVRVFTVPAGETTKSWEHAGSLLEEFSAFGMGRDGLVVALGGGVVGDLAGFCAAVYMRGIDVVQVPTTLLAQVDSSIGGKTGVDLPLGKNLAGAFWPPRTVVADTALLRTLPVTEWRSGMAEVVKSAILDGEASVAGLERSAASLGDRDEAAVDSAVRMAAGLKVRIVSEDEREGGAREALNYGHTLGHALENVAGYGAMPHGVAVAEGIRFAALLAERELGTDPAWTARQDRLLVSAGLARTGCPFEPDALMAAMRADKKTRAGAVRFVLSDGPGVWEVRTVGDAVLTAALAQWCGRTAT